MTQINTTYEYCHALVIYEKFRGHTNFKSGSSTCQVAGRLKFMIDDVKVLYLYL